MIGIPGSGKDYYIEHHKGLDDVIISSDDIRAELGDVNDQSRNAEVFTIFYDRLEQALKGGVPNVCINATNVTKKNRERAIALGKQYGCYIQAVVLRTAISVCIKNDMKRDRTVGKDVIYKFGSRFEEPSLEEGFDSIITISYDEVG